MSKEPKWTPGPWVLVGDSRTIIESESGDGIIGINSQSMSWLEIDDANAHLIAAAPELYDALLYVLSVCPAIDYIGEEARAEARAALAKARGES